MLAIGDASASTCIAVTPRGASCNVLAFRRRSPLAEHRPL